MADYKKKSWHHYWFVFYAIILFIAVNILTFSWLKTINIDVTDEQKFSVSEHSLKIINTIPEQVHLKLYISDVILTQMPAMKNYVTYVQDFLHQLEKHSNGRLKIVTTIIQPFSKEEDQAIALGLKGIPSKDGAGIFFGIIAENMLDGEGIIPFLNPEREAFIEYDIARLIQGVIHMDKVKIAISSSLPLETGSGGTVGALNGTSNPYYIFQALQKSYDLVGLSNDYHELLDEKTRPKVAVILHPRPLNDAANDALKRYLSTGGRALIAVDPLSEALPLPIGSSGQNAEVYSDMPKLFKEIGLSYQNQLIVLDKHHARTGVNPETAHSDVYLAWLKLTHDNFSHQNPTMTSVRELSVSTIGFIQRDADFKGNLNFTPLIYSLQKADFITREAMAKITNITELNDTYQEKAPYTTAMLITGRMQTAQKAPDKNSADMAVIVIADSDFLDDRLWLQKTDSGNSTPSPFADNLNLMLNYVDYLVGDDALLALRGKKSLYRPLTYLNNIRQTAEQKFSDQEKILKEKIQLLRKNIDQINKDYSVSSTHITPDKVTQEIQKFSQELLVSRKQLREVRRNMNKDIQDSERMIKLSNMIVVPLGFAILAMLIIGIRKAKAFQKKRRN